MQLTTREAIKVALDAMYDDYIKDSGCSAAHTKEAMKVICDHYGFKISQFFDVEEA